MNWLIKNAFVVNQGSVKKADVLIRNGLIERVGDDLKATEGVTVLDASGKYLLPGIIDAQVHFREPGLTHKATIYTESKAAVAGGITSYMEMPNTIPNTLTQELLEEKYAIAAKSSLANYSFFMGVNGANWDEAVKTNPKNVCGITDDGLYFSGTGNLLCSNPAAMEQIFSESKMLVTIHSEDESIIEKNLETFKLKYGEDIPVEFHPLIRSEEACLVTTKKALEIAREHNTRFHLLHVSTAKEAALFDNTIPLKQKRITSEVCIHHLWFCDEDYKRLGVKIKWNPAIKTARDRDGLLQALIDGRIDIITTDHAPHTLEEKNQNYIKSFGGAPMVQHALCAMLEFVYRKKLSLEMLVEKMCHNVADLYQVEKRGYIKEGYWADLVLVDLNDPWTVEPPNILYKCGWSPMEGETFHSRISQTFVNGNLVYDQGKFNEQAKGQRLLFERDEG